MTGRFLTSAPSTCTRCERSIRVGASVYYDTSADDRVRVGDCCVRFDLFGVAA